MFWVRVFAVVVLGSSSLFGQAQFPKPSWEEPDSRVSCRHDNNEAVAVGNYQVRLVEVPDPENDDQSCDAFLIDPEGKQTLLLEDYDVSIHQGTGKDVFGDGTPALVLEGDSGGAHCCYTYVIARLAEKPLILPRIENESPFYFFRDSSSGRFLIMTWDGAFDYFDGMSHAYSPFPRVVLQVEASGLRDVSARFVKQYDSEIAASWANIPKGGLSKVQREDLEGAKKAALEIVFSYLYSGREAQAWQTLDDLWPATDRDRIKKLIVETKAEGILPKLGRTESAPALTVFSPH